MESKVFKVILTAFVITMCVVLTSKAQDDPPLTSETERILDKYSDKISSFFSEVADQAKVGAEYAFEKYTEFVLASAISDVLRSFMLLLFSLYAIKQSIFFCEKDNWKGESPPQYIALFFSSVALVAGLIMVLNSISNSLPAIISPEGYVINQLIESL